MPSEPAVRAEILATGADLAVNTLYIQLRSGLIPPPDVAILPPRNGVPVRGWTLSTLRAWRPDIADRCAAIHAALEPIPLLTPAARTPVKPPRK